MPMFVLRKMDPEFWERVKQRAHAEGLPLDRLAIRLFELYLQHGLTALEAAGKDGLDPPRQA